MAFEKSALKNNSATGGYFVISGTKNAKLIYEFIVDGIIRRTK